MAEVDDPPTEWFSTDRAAAELGIGRVFRVRRADIDPYLESVRIQPGDLDNLVRSDETED